MSAVDDLDMSGFQLRLRKPGRWTLDAACRTVDDRDVFYPEPGRAAADRARAICSGCTVRAECITDAMSRFEIHGVWGGLTRNDRLRLRMNPTPGRTRRMTTPTRHDELTVVKLLAADHSLSFTATATQLSDEQVREIGARYGYPDNTRLGWAADELQRTLDNEAIAAIPAGRGEPPKRTPIPRPAAAPTPPRAPALRTVPPVPTPAVTPQAPTPFIIPLLARGGASKRAATRKLAERISDLIEDLAARLDSEDAEARAVAEREAEHKAALAAVRKAEEDLRKARERARKLKTPAGAGDTTPTRTTATNRQVDYDAREVRAWARANNVDCPTYGRFLPAALVNAWRAATTRDEAAS